jgi:DHA1 family bicyclomycin/chloramphenicol resistance-like MFS transporter
MLQKKETPAAAERPADIGFAEFVSLMALMMGLTALAVDIMLPALGEIGAALNVAEPNDRQLIITYYLFGFAFGQLVFGPLSDRFGRKRPLAAGLAIFAIADVMALLATDATTLFLARAAQGLGAAAPRVIALAIIRDRYSGRQMSQVMSFVMMIFVLMPILAPAIGQTVMQIVVWRGVFGVLLIIALVTLVWSGLRLPETRVDGQRAAVPLRSALRTIVSSRQTVGYAITFAFFFGVMMSYIASAEQIFIDIYELGTGFPLVFASVSSALIVASFANSRLVVRHGMRRVSHLALLGFLCVCAIMAIAGFPERPPLVAFCLFMSATFFCFGLMAPNFNALAMEPMGSVAGTASSLIGFYTTAAGAVFGALVGQSFDGTVRPLLIGFTVLGTLALISTLVTERGKLARQSHVPPRT